MTYTVGTLTFATKGDVRTHARHVLNRAGLGEILTSSDDAFARALLSNHHDAPRKHGVGVDAIVVVTHSRMGHPQLPRPTRGRVGRQLVDQEVHCQPAAKWSLDRKEQQ